MFRIAIWFSLFSLSLLLVPCGVNAQETETLLSGQIRHGGFGAPVYGVTVMNGQPAYLRGTRGAWIINLSANHALQLGLAGYRTGTDVEPARWRRSDIDERDMRTSYGGFELEYVNRGYRLVHYSFQTLIGSGNVRYSDRNRHPERGSDTYFVLQPGVNATLNVTRWFRISGGVFYRYAGGVNLEGTGNSDLSGVASFVALRFGKF